MSHQRGSGMSRRRFVGAGLRTAGAAGLVATGLVDPVTAVAAPTTVGAAWQNDRAARDSVERAYRFLDFMMDAYQTGSTLRLIQSYSDQLGLQSTAFTYDNALAIIAYLHQRRSRNGLARARVLGDSLLYAQTHDPTYTDGRLRQAYFVAPTFVRPDGTVNLALDPFFFVGSAVGDMAWAAIALAQLAAATNDQRYLDGAVRLGQWIVDNTYSTTGLGGYSFGVDGNNQPIPNKSTEHNIDVYALFTNLLAPLTGNPQWRDRGQHALQFIERVWNAEGGFFYTGSNDGATINPSPLPEDPQSWSYLALLDQRYAIALDWAKTNLATTDTPQSINARFTGNLAFSGVTFSDVSRRSVDSANPATAQDPDAVWFEGTAHMATALLARNGAGDGVASFERDRDLAQYYLANIRLAQATLGRGQTVGGTAIPDQWGVVAASSILNTGFGFSYFPNVHIGATSWYLIAAAAGNPYQLRKHT